MKLLTELLFYVMGGVAGTAEGAPTCTKTAETRGKNGRGRRRLRGGSTLSPSPSPTVTTTVFPPPLQQQQQQPDEREVGICINSNAAVVDDGN